MCELMASRSARVQSELQSLCAGKGLLTSAEDKWIHLSYLETDKVVSWQSEGVNELVMLDDGRLLITPYGENKVSCQGALDVQHDIA